MGALINIFKSIFGGIFGFITGLLSGKKDSTGTKAIKAAKPKKGKNGFYMEATAAQLEALPDSVASTIVKADVPAASVKGGKKEKASKAAPLAAKAEPKPAALPSTDELIAAALAAVAKPPAGTAEAETLQEVTMGFAERNMIPTLTTGRRRPGPSLLPFKAMLKEIKG